MTTDSRDATAVIHPFGVDATTGDYFGEPTTAAAVAAARDVEESNSSIARTIKGVVRANERQFGVRPGIDADDLAQAGWGVILPASASPDVLTPLRPLLELRKSQSSDRYREFTASTGYRTGENANVFLSRHGAGPGNANRVPYYLLLIGTPEEIPYSFQYGLDVQYAVGRISFSSFADYERYACTVAEVENAAATSRRATFFAPDSDYATQLSAGQLVNPVADHSCRAVPAWMCGRLIGDEATKAGLLDALSTGQSSLLFSASHGIVFPRDDGLQRAAQGGLLCQDWPGPSRRPLSRDWYVSADDLGANVHVRGLIAMLFACYGAGTPRYDYFPERSVVQKREIAPADFIAALPERLLTHPNGSALAVVGHVERTWTLSFMWPHAGVQNIAFADTITMLMQGHRLGFAMEHFGQRFAELGNQLLDIYDILRSDPSLVPEPVAFSTLWTARNDARSFLTLGDPAVRLT